MRSIRTILVDAMAPPWIRTMNNHKPDPRGRKWREDDWLLVDGNEVLARTYPYEHGPHGGRWFWAMSAW